jgi:GNAT superfamily N-acetyltransferase
VLDYAAKQFDVYKEFKVSRYLTAYGLVIHPAYRGRGVATEILRARVPLIKALGLNVIVNAFTGIGSQMAAKKADYEEVFTIKYVDLKNASPRFSFLSTKTEYFKIMAVKIW